MVNFQPQRLKLSFDFIAIYTLRFYKYKLKVRMQEVSPVQEYKDVDLNGGSYEKAAISRLLTDGEVKHVVGKLKRL